MENKRYNFEVADIFRKFSDAYLQEHQISHQQQKALTDIINCRSEALEGHTLRCNNCGHLQLAYNSCRNRHCPKCQYLRQLIWVDKLKARLLPVKYFHIVFTIPASLRKLFYANQSICYELLMKSASQAILKAAQNPHFPGANTGCVAILHTWGEALTYHPHVHLLVPAGGFDDDLIQWVHSRRKFFAPVKALSSLFRGIFAQNIYKLADKLVPSDGNERIDIDSLRALIYKDKWNVFSKPSFNNSEKVIQYLGRYTHRVAISNDRILDISEDKVHFLWKDNREKGRTKIMKLDGVDFISRFMMHVLPGGFYKIRYYGIFANKQCSNILDIWLSLSNREMYLSEMEGKNWQELVQEIFGYDLFHCKICKTGIMIRHDNIDIKPRAA